MTIDFTGPELHALRRCLRGHTPAVRDPRVWEDIASRIDAELSERDAQRVVGTMGSSFPLPDSCRSCKSAWEEYQETGKVPAAPRHQTGSRCQSGQRPHCTCPICWG